MHCVPVDLGITEATKTIEVEEYCEVEEYVPIVAKQKGPDPGRLGALLVKPHLSIKLLEE